MTEKEIEQITDVDDIPEEALEELTNTKGEDDNE